MLFSFYFNFLSYLGTYFLNGWGNIRTTVRGLKLMNFLGYFTSKPRRYKLDSVFFLTPYYLERWPLETGPHFKTHVQFSPTLNTKRSLFEQMRKSCKGNCELYSKVMLVILCEYRLKPCEAARKKQLSKHPTCTSKILVELHSADYDLWCFSLAFFF